MGEIAEWKLRGIPMARNVVYEPAGSRTRLTDATLSRRAFLSRETAALIMFLCSSLGVAGGSSDSFLHTARMACSL